MFIFFHIFLVYVTCHNLGIYSQTLQGSAGNTQGDSIVEIKSGGYFVCGSTRAYGNGGYDWILTKWKNDGTLEHKKTVGESSESGNDYCKSVKETHDGGIIATGTLEKEGKNIITLMKFNSSMTHKWSKSITEEESGETFDVFVMSRTGDIVISGNLGPPLNNQAFISVFTSTGALKWSKIFGDRVGNNYAFSITESHDLQIILLLCLSGNFLVIAKLDASNGEEIWKYQYGKGFPNSISRTKSNGFIVTGYVDNSAGFEVPKIVGTKDFFLLKVDGSGNVEFSQNYGIENKYVAGKSVVEDRNGEYLVAGVEGENKGFFMKITGDGEAVLWERMVEVGLHGISVDGDGIISVTGVRYVVGATDSLYFGRIMVFDENDDDENDYYCGMLNEPDWEKSGLSLGFYASYCDYVFSDFEVSLEPPLLTFNDFLDDPKIDCYECLGKNKNNYFGGNCDRNETGVGSMGIEIDGANIERFYSIDRDYFDGGLIICGEFSDVGKGLIIKLSSNGEIENKKIYDHDATDSTSCYSVKSVRDGGYITCGKLVSSLVEKANIIKFTKSLEIEWDITLPTATGICNTIKELPISIYDNGGGFLCVGEFDNNFGVSLISSSGIVYSNIFWIDDGNSTSAVDFAEFIYAGDEYMVILGYTETFGSSIPKISTFCIKNRDWGSPLWKFQYGYGIPTSIIYTSSDECFLITGFLDSGTTLIGDGDIFLLKLRDDGSEIVFSKNYGEIDKQLLAANIIEDSFGDYLIVGEIDGDDGLILKISNSDGGILWQKIFIAQVIHDIVEIIGTGYSFIAIDSGSGSSRVEMISYDGISCSGGNDDVNMTGNDLGYFASIWNDVLSDSGSSGSVVYNHNIFDFVGNENLECMKCKDLYYGENCEITKCFDVFSNQTSSVCNGHGYCYEPDKCSCFGEYVGDFCNGTNCFNIWFDDDSVCSDHGKCIAFDICECDEHYFDFDCSVTTCNETFSNHTEIVCSNTSGKCISYDHCACKPHYHGRFCEVTECAGFLSNETEKMCNGHGKCFEAGKDRCSSCDEHYYGKYCEIFECAGFLSNETEICYNHGFCTTPGSDDCDCFDNYFESDCSLFSCYNISAKDTVNVCNGHGSCIAFDTCICLSGYSNLVLEIESIQIPCGDWYCGTIHKNDLQNVCNDGRGKCISSHLCECRDEYEGNLCDSWKCMYVDYDDPNVCNGNGDCVSPDSCECNAGFRGDQCETDIILIAVLSPVLSLSFISLIIFSCFSFFLIAICVCCLISTCFCAVFVLGCLLCIVSFVTLFVTLLTIILRLRVKKFSKLRNFDILMKEQEMEEDTSIAHIKVNRTLFEVNYEEIKVDRILGEGGSNSIVYLAKWSGSAIAFKCFKTRHLCESQDTFNEFEREVQIMSSVNHPNIVQFLGATLNPPRVGILMEFCENGEIFKFIEDFKKKHTEGRKLKYPLSEKLRMMNEVVSSLDYLHSRSIIHRDLKSENVLIDSKERSKLMDFGLSKLVDRMSQAKTTRIGTAVYMAPEIIQNEYYNEKCDVFSFAILLYIVITENENPYGKGKDFGIEFKVGNDENFRPKIDVFEKELKIAFKEDKKLSEKNVKYDDFKKWMVVLLTNCWSHDPEKRYSARKLGEIILNKREEMIGELELEEEEEEEYNKDNNKKTVLFSKPLGGNNQEKKKEKEEENKDEKIMILEKKLVEADELRKKYEADFFEMKEKYQILEEELLEMKKNKKNE